MARCSAYSMDLSETFISGIRDRSEESQRLGPSPDLIAGRRILFVVNVDWFFLSHRLPLALGAREAGADVWVAAAHTGRGKEIEDHGLAFVPIPMQRSVGRITEEVRALTSLVKLYRDLKPDLVHHVAVKPIIYGSLVSRLLRIPTVNAISGFGHLFGTERGRSTRLLAEAGFRIALRNPASFTIFQNSDDREDFISRSFLLEDQAALIRGSGVDCELFKPRSMHRKTRLVVFASRMIREKGVQEFVDAARALRSLFPDVNFVLLGKPDESLTAISVQQLERWNSEGLVEWKGHVGNLEEVLPEASIVVLPTYYREGVPKILLEAAACGVPVVTTDIPGCRDVVQAGRTGLLVKPRDQIALVEAIRALLDDDDYRQRLGNNARQLAESEFTVEAVVEHTLGLYRRLLENRPPKSLKRVL